MYRAPIVMKWTHSPYQIAPFHYDNILTLEARAAWKVPDNQEPLEDKAL